jgi:hypothetical protein
MTPSRAKKVVRASPTFKAAKFYLPDKAERMTDALVEHFR